MPVRKVEIIIKDKTKKLGERYYFSGDKILYVNVKCPICKEIRSTRYDYYKDKYRKEKYFVCQSCRSIKEKGSTDIRGYITRHYKTFPTKYWNILKVMCKSNGQIKEHRAIMAIKMNRPLETWEIVHHINGIRNDNREENLEIFSTLENYNKHHCCGFRENEVLEDNVRLVEENKKLKEEIMQLKEVLKNANTQ